MRSRKPLPPHLVAQWHPKKNGDLRPEDVPSYWGKTVWWKCPVADDHEWQATPKDRSQGSGCPCCLGRKIVLSNCLSTLRPDLDAEWHPELNGDLRPQDVPPASNKKVWWRSCPKGHPPFEATVTNRSCHGKGCPYCGHVRVTPGESLADVYPAEASEWHPELNGDLRPQDVAPYSNKKAWWVGHCGHPPYCSIIANRTNLGQGCPTCNESHGEAAVAAALKKLKVPFRREFRPKFAPVRRYFFDFVMYHNRRVGFIEYHGSQHYHPKGFGSKDPQRNFEGIKRRDRIKREWARSSGYPYLEIPYTEPLDNVEKIISDWLLWAFDGAAAAKGA